MWIKMEETVVFYENWNLQAYNKVAPSVWIKEATDAIKQNRNIIKKAIDNDLKLWKEW